MLHADGLSKFHDILVIEDNSLKLNLSSCQSQDAKIKELCDSL